MTTSHAGLLQDYIFVVASVEADLWFTVSDALLPLVCLVSQAYTLKIYKKDVFLMRSTWIQAKPRIHEDVFQMQSIIKLLG